MGSGSCDGAPSTSCVGLVVTRVGEPDAGNLHVRFDEGEGLTSLPTRLNLRFRLPLLPQREREERAAGVHGDVLPSSDRVRDRSRLDLAANGELPQQRTGARVERVEEAFPPSAAWRR